MALMDLVHLAMPTLFVVWDFHNKPIFHRYTQFDTKMTSFCIVPAAIHNFELSLAQFMLSPIRAF